MTATRMRVISDNDYSGDPDGLIQLAHHALSSSVDLVAVIGSHLAPGDPFDPSGRSAANAAAAARRVLHLAGRGDVVVHAGAQDGLPDVRTPHDSAGARAIVAEAMRDDPRPLYVTLGAGLTELASAYLLEPRIAGRLTAIWIGGPEHPGLTAAPPPGSAGVEYNLRIDVTAAQVVFDAPIPLWQVPRDAYRQVLMGVDEIELSIRTAGPLGAHLADALERVRGLADVAGADIGETYVLGDSPLVLLTALQSAFEPDPSSSRYVTVPAPRIAGDGSYLSNPDGRLIRTYTHLDTRLVIGDLIAKLARHAGGSPGR